MSTAKLRIKEDDDFKEVERKVDKLLDDHDEVEIEVD